MDARLRVGLLLDSVFLPSWAFTAVRRLVGSNAVELVLVVINQSPVAPFSSGLNVLRNPRHGLYPVFNAIDQRLFIHGSNALSQVDATEILSDAPRLVVNPLGEYGEQQFSTVDIEAIRFYQPDILVKLGFGGLTGEVLCVATFGTWAYRWGDSRKIEAELTGFWELVRGRPEIRVALQQLRPNAVEDVTLFESRFSTYPYSPARSRNSILWAAAFFLTRQVEQLHRVGGERFFRERMKPEEENPSRRQVDGFPSNVTVLWIMTKLALRNLLEIYRRNFCRERWELLFDFSPHPQPPKDIYAFRKISPPRDRFWADPHVVFQEPNYYIFVEEYPYQTRRGHISVIEMDRNGNYKPPIPILQEDCHLSFPFVFDWMGHSYMIPESSGKRTIDLYECIKFPDQWRYKLTLMKDVQAVDTTVFYTEGKWWLFTAITEQEWATPHVELFLFYSNKLFTDQWNPHPMNPIVSDVRKARGAGRIFQKDGKLIRPSQDCSVTYGYGFDLNEIVVLSESTYCERTVASVRPDSKKGILATHTYANQGDLTVVDALTRPPKWVD